MQGGAHPTLGPWRPCSIPRVAPGHWASFPLVLSYKRNTPSRAQFTASEEAAIYLVWDFNTWHHY